MRAIEISSPGGPDVLRVVERPLPSLREGEILVEVRAAGVSRADVMQREGSYPPPPGASDIPGLEAAGIVRDANGVSAVQNGDAVCVLLSGGGYAEFVAVPAELALPVPEHWNFVEAATLPENMFTVYDNLFTRARFLRGESVLVHGGTSGIGTTAIMLAKAFGASFIAATAGSAQKCAACRDLGADVAIDYKAQDFVRAVNSATQGRGVNVVVDIVGGDYVARDIEALCEDGRVVCLATSGGRTMQLDLGAMVRKRASVLASSLRSRTVAQKAAVAQALRENVWPRLPARDAIRPLVDSTFSFDRAPDAHRRMESSAHVGKIVLVP